MKEAMFYTKGEGSRVTCKLCSHRCRIKEGKQGICGVRENQNGTLYSLVYGRLTSHSIDPIEKKPLFHFKPGSRSLSIATVGCNFRCLHCQNYQISQYRHHGGDPPGRMYSAEAVVEDAVQSGCASISYTYIEPTVFYEFAYDCARLARDRAVGNVFVSNGYMTPEVTSHIAPLLDAINIDLKGFSEDFYTKVCKARLQPVLDTIRLFHELGVWVEVTTLIIPGLNDTAEQLRDTARFIQGVSPAIPWHVTAFYPTYKMQDRPPTPVASLRLAREIGYAEGLRYVYEGNTAEPGGEDTRCPDCDALLIQRSGFSSRMIDFSGGQCGRCGQSIEGIW